MLQFSHLVTVLRINQHICNRVNLYLSIKQNPVIPNINNGAIIKYVNIFSVKNCIPIIVIIDTFVNIKMYYRPDMGREPV